MALSPKRQHGYDQEHEFHNKNALRDARPGVRKVIDSLGTPDTMMVTLAVLAASAFLVPSLADFIAIIALILTLWGLRQKETLPIKAPISANILDKNQLNERDQPSPGAGIFFVGNQMRTAKEIWLTNDDCRQHFLVLGTTGAGKTEALIGFVSNALSWSSGCLYCDGKADVSLFAKIFALARRFNRTDDLLVLNFMTGNKDVGANEGRISSNTINPFTVGSSDALTTMIVSLMAEAGDNAMWKGRAVAMFTGLMKALVRMRNAGTLDLNVGTIRDHLSLKRIIDLSNNNDLPKEIRNSLQKYLSSLAGYKEELGHKQGNTTLEQHGYLEMQFTQIMGSLSDVYGHIFSSPYGEIDMSDVVLNRRILLVLLPSLEKDQDELANLGKIVVATLKGMMGQQLGSEIEGSWAGVVDNRTTTSPSPFIVILDEVGYYTVSGLALIAAQARSLGFSMVYASQDIPSMRRLNDKEADSIIANTNTKIFMRLEEPKESMDLAVTLGGKATVASMKSMEGGVGEVSSRYYRDNMQVQLEAMDRIDPRDLKDQSPGEFHILHKDLLVRGKTFYANAPGAVKRYKLKLRTNHFIPVPKPTLEDLETEADLPRLVEIFLDPDLDRRIANETKTSMANVMSNAQTGDEIAISALAYENYIAKGRSSIAGQGEAHYAAIVALASLIGAEEDKVSSLRPMPSRMPDDISMNEFDRSSLRQGMPPDIDEDDIEGLIERPSFEDEMEKQWNKSPSDFHHKAHVKRSNHDIVIDGQRHMPAMESYNTDVIHRVLSEMDFEPEVTTPEGHKIGRSKEDLDKEFAWVTGSAEDMFHDNAAPPEMINKASVELEQVVPMEKNYNEVLSDFDAMEKESEKTEESGSNSGNIDSQMSDLLDSLMND